MLETLDREEWPDDVKDYWQFVSKTHEKMSQLTVSDSHLNTMRMVAANLLQPSRLPLAVQHSQGIALALALEVYLDEN